jgi:hypothetical protein
MTENSSLPTEQDFDPWGGDLDAQCAWRNFGGLAIDRAKAKFRENPLLYQEDFMFMGTKAFAYYFPVIEEYLRTIPDGIRDERSLLVSRSRVWRFKWDEWTADEIPLYPLRLPAPSPMSEAKAWWRDIFEHPQQRPVRTGRR